MRVQADSEKKNSMKITKRAFAYRPKRRTCNGITIYSLSLENMPHSSELASPESYVLLAHKSFYQKKKKT